MPMPRWWAQINKRVFNPLELERGRRAVLRHVGRVSHESFHGGELPVSASDGPYRNRTTVRGEDGRPTRVSCPVPRPLGLEEDQDVEVDKAEGTEMPSPENGDELPRVPGAQFRGDLLGQLSTAAEGRWSVLLGTDIQ